MEEVLVMEDHFLLFPVMIIIGLGYAIWYAIKIVWILILLIGRLFVGIIGKKEKVVNNSAANTIQS